MSSNAFQRSPSKVWWAQGLDEHSHTEWHNRNGTGSPSSHKSQDSGFSDSEISPALGATAKPTDTTDDKHEKTCNAASKHLHVTEQLSANIRKDFTLADSSTPKKNFTENNIKEKYSPKKSVTKYLTDESLRKIKDPSTYNCRSLPTTPVDNTRNCMCLSKSTSQAPSPLPSPLLHQCRRLTLYNSPDTKPQTSIENSPNASLDETKLHLHHSTKVSRNLFKYFPTDNQDNVAITSTTNTEYNNYEAQQGSDYETIANNTENINLEERHYNLHSITLPITQPTMKSKLNITVPLYYQYHLDKIETDFDDSNNSSDHSIQNSDSDVSLNDSSNDVISCESFSYQNEEISDCEKEVEALFPELFENIDSPTHTSTPKQNLFKKCSASSMRKRIMKQKGKSASYEIIERCTETNPAVQLQIPSVKCWLTEVEKLYEPECMTTLQCKSIAYDLAKHVARLADNTTTPIRDLLRHSKIILKEFNNIKMKVKLNQMEHLAPLTQSLVGNVTEFVLKNMINSQSSSLVDVKMTKLEIENLLDLCGKLRKSTILQCPSIDDISRLLINLQETFYTTENNILAMQIQLLVNAIEDSSTHLALRGVLSGLTSLATQCERLSNLIVETGGPRALLILCVESKASTIRTMALRTLATVCCSTAAIRQVYFTQMFV